MTPTKTHKIYFKYSNLTGYYFLFEMPDGTWNWEAYGNSGKETSQNQAMYHARLWITESQIKKEN